MKKTKLFLVEDHELVRKGVRSIIDLDQSIDIIGEYDRATKALDALDNGENPDIILMDISMPEMTGLEAAKLIGEKYPDLRIIILSMYKDEEYVMEGLNFNIAGYVVKDSVADEILVAIEKVLEGGKFFSREVIDTALNSYKEIKKEKKKVESVQLTKRELEVLNDISDGLKSQEIADKLFISERTVEAHRGNIMKKLHAKNMAELIKKAMNLGLLKP
ncbi:two component transcriptional regulator, LuxR family [Ekhidna lutea]|uniref:Two component transcriptional regulator, LuxR family n=1 Tax=Ekhidna lutea TaxID=447679 RepID=A0A239KK22_EKHLU|nr:response regulator transcription factor [Ekhidna lutea]SNT18415.1 two component transcriptional regulator, LuxR family [Ekhidna lutea]